MLNITIHLDFKTTLAYNSVAERSDKMWFHGKKSQNTQKIHDQRNHPKVGGAIAICSFFLCDTTLNPNQCIKMQVSGSNTTFFIGIWLWVYCNIIAPTDKVSLAQNSNYKWAVKNFKRAARDVPERREEVLAVWRGLDFDDFDLCQCLCQSLTCAPRTG